jgi:Flp pilus assembly protein TadG
MAPLKKRFNRSPGQRGAVAVVVALSALILFGFAGIAIDVGRLFINRTELQTAADACALAAAAELTCDPTGGACPASFLLNAQAAGIYAAGRNKRDFQVNPVVVAPADVTFNTALAPNANYLSIAAGASSNSRYVMCTARATGIGPWFMGVLGAGAQTVTSAGVATRAPASSFCNAAPIGICAKPGGYAVGEWIAADFHSNGDDDNTGSFKWIDYTPNGGGTSEARDEFVGNAGVCNIKVGDAVALPGVHQGIKSAYNTRFGIYPNGANGYDATTAPPDRTGYAYPNKNPAPGYAVIAIGTSAYADYRARQGANSSTVTPFISNQYDVSGAGGNIPGNPDGTLSDYLTLGSDRRLVAAPIIDCASGTPIINSMACVLMLNPMSNGATGTIYLEYRGLTTAAGSPCRVGGLSGGAASAGPQVPTLVQ